MSAKQPACCARMQSRITSADADLRRAARRLALRPDSPTIKATLAEAKTARDDARLYAFDHEAGHAEEAS